MPKYHILSNYNQDNAHQENFIKVILKNFNLNFNKKSNILFRKYYDREHLTEAPEYLFINNQSIQGKYIKGNFIAETKDKRIVAYNRKNDNIFLGKKNRKGEANGMCFSNFHKNNNCLVEGRAAFRTKHGSIISLQHCKKPKGCFAGLLNLIKKCFTKKHINSNSTSLKNTLNFSPISFWPGSFINSAVNTGKALNLNVDNIAPLTPSATIFSGYSIIKKQGKSRKFIPEQPEQRPTIACPSINA